MGKSIGKMGEKVKTSACLCVSIHSAGRNLLVEWMKM